jgi:hypothetical protein
MNKNWRPIKLFSEKRVRFHQEFRIRRGGGEPKKEYI